MLAALVVCGCLLGVQTSSIFDSLHVGTCSGHLSRPSTVICSSLKISSACYGACYWLLSTQGPDLRPCDMSVPAQRQLLTSETRCCAHHLYYESRSYRNMNIHIFSFFLNMHATRVTCYHPWVLPHFSQPLIGFYTHALLCQMVERNMSHSRLHSFIGKAICVIVDWIDFDGAVGLVVMYHLRMRLR